MLSFDTSMMYTFDPKQQSTLDAQGWSVKEVNMDEGCPQVVYMNPNVPQPSGMACQVYMKFQPLATFPGFLFTIVRIIDMTSESKGTLSNDPAAIGTEVFEQLDAIYQDSQ